MLLPLKRTPPTLENSTSMSTTIDYDNKVFLAPMVRVGTLPFRLTALGYGADLVWTEELVDKRVIGSVRKYNPATQTIEYWKGEKLTFSTHDDEKGRVIFQLGTADPDLALKAALTVKEDVAGIDVNCGCPKKFSIQGGMGAALLTNPDTLKKILINLVQNVGLPVTCKIRLLDEKKKTIELVKMIESTGVKMITIHCRTKEQRSSTAAKWEEFKEIAQAVKNIPVAINGDVYSWQDIPRIKELTNAHSFMIARGAQYNPSAFRKEGLLPDEEVVETYIKKCIEVNNVHQNTKYVLLTMTTDPKFTRTDKYRKIQQAKSALALSEIFGLGSYYHEVQALHKSRLGKAEPSTTTTDAVTGDKRKSSSSSTADKDITLKKQKPNHEQTVATAVSS